MCGRGFLDSVVVAPPHLLPISVFPLVCTLCYPGVYFVFPLVCTLCHPGVYFVLPWCVLRGRSRLTLPPPSVVTAAEMEAFGLTAAAQANNT